MGKQIIVNNDNSRRWSTHIESNFYFWPYAFLSKNRGYIIVASAVFHWHQLLHSSIKSFNCLSASLSSLHWSLPFVIISWNILFNDSHWFSLNTWTIFHIQWLYLFPLAFVITSSACWISYWCHYLYRLDHHYLSMAGNIPTGVESKKLI